MSLRASPAGQPLQPRVRCVRWPRNGSADRRVRSRSNGSRARFKAVAVERHRKHRTGMLWSFSANIFGCRSPPRQTQASGCRNRKRFGERRWSFGQGIDQHVCLATRRAGHRRWAGDGDQNTHPGRLTGKAVWRVLYSRNKQGDAGSGRGTRQVGCGAAWPGGRAARRPRPVMGAIG